MKIVYAKIFFFLFCCVFSTLAQTGTAGNPFTSLGQAQNVTTDGVYHFNLTGTTFSTQVLAGGWVQVAIDFGGSTGSLPQGTSLNTATRGILNPTILLKFGSANKARIRVSTGALDVQNTNASILSRIVNNQALHKGSNDNSFQTWTGTNTAGATFSAGGCNATTNIALHQRIIHAACMGAGVHWIPYDNSQQIRSDLGNIAANQYFQLFVQAPFVAVVNGPTINSQPSNATQNLCINGAATLLSVSASSPNPITYQWYSNATASTNGGIAIAGETNASYLPPSNVAGTTYYYVICTDAVGPVTSSVSGAIIVSNPTVAGTASGDQTKCAGSIPTNLTLTGHTGSVQWQWSSDNVTFTNIAGATSATLTSGQMGALSVTRYYRAIITNGGCNAEMSNTVTVTITPLPVITSTQGATNCGPGSLTLNASAASGTFSWYAALTGGVSLGNNSSYTTPTISTTTTYYVDLTDNGCTSNPRLAVTATINSIPSPTITQSGCGSPRYLSTNPGGNALNLGSANSTKYVSVPSSLNASFNTNNVTIEGWFNFSNTNTGNPMLIGEAYNGDNKITFCMYRNGAYITAGFFNGSWTNVNSSSTIALNTWTHIAATYDQSAIKIYINGVLNASLNSSLALPTGSEVWFLGKRWDGTNEMISGFMDELRIWNVARTQTQIQESMYSNVPVNAAGLRAYFKMDESTGTVASDATGNNFNGTLLAGPTWQVPSTSPIGGITGNTYLWSPNGETTSSISATSNGTYSLVVTSPQGCSSAPVSTNVTISAAPNAGTLSGNQAICVAGTTTFSTDGDVGGTWTSSATGIATVNATTGVITGVAAGTATITYTIAASGSCSAVSSTRTVTVTAAPNAGTLNGTQGVCLSGTSTFTTNGNAGGTWSSSDVNVATINATTGAITPVAAGTATMTYMVTGTGGCNNASNTRTVTITTPSIAGTLSGNQIICSAQTTTFTVNGASGAGTFTSNATGIATVNAASGVVTGVAGGTATITFTIAATGGCPAVNTTRTVTVTTAPNSGTLAGTQAICLTGSVTFTSNGNAGGTWSSSDINVATINSSTGAISPVAAGTATMSYTITGTGGCNNVTSTRNVTVTNPQTPGTVSGNQAICSNGTTQFAASGTAGGSWTSSAAGIATVNSSTGLVTAVANASGTATITYTLLGTGGCPNATATQTVTVTAVPLITTQPSTAIQNICQNGTPTTLSIVATGGGITYQWYENSVNNTTTGTAIIGANSTTFTPSSAIVGTMYYYCVVSGSCSPDAKSNVSGAININAPTTVSNAGPDQTGNPTCGLTTVTLAGNPPTIGTGLWSIISGAGGSITTPSSPTSNFNGVSGNTYTLRWTITNGGCTSIDDVIISLSAIPAVAGNAPAQLNAQVLVVAGGGSGGLRHAGGGGAGGVIYNSSFNINQGSYPVTVGAGGVGNSVSGANSVFSSLTAIGGGGGGNNGQVGKPGGSGGGGSNGSVGGNGTAGQGNKGGNQNNGAGCCYANGAGGGGAAAAGANTSGAVSSAGGDGLAFNISGSSVYYGGGGGGGTGASAVSLPGGIGGGGAGGNNSSGVHGVAGTPNTGGGGGGGGASNIDGNGGNGGSGIVIISYVGTPIATGGTITQVGGNTIHTFTSNGTFAFTGSPTASIPHVYSCSPTAFTIVGTPAAGFTLDWYDAAIGGNLLASGTNSYTTPVINTSATYYVTVRNTTTGCISATRLAVNANVYSAPTMSANQSICSGSTPSNITISGSSGTIQWQVSSDSVNFSNIVGATAATLTGAQMGALTAKRFYRAALTGGLCGTMNSDIVTVAVIYAPTVTSTNTTTNCGPGTITLTANSTGTINWYAAITGGSSLGTGTTYTTPSISASTTYFYDVTGNGCTSTPRSNLTATINPIPPTAVLGNGQVEYLVVGGGGGGGHDGAGGGGGGQVKTGTIGLNAGTYSVTIGAGGANSTVVGGQAADGGTSTINFPTAITSIGGGGGGSKQANGRPGANGGGGGHNASAVNTGGAGTTGGFNGGNNGVAGTTGAGGGGGGGAAGIGTVGPAGNGGPGIASSITGTTAYYGGGGGGGSHSGAGTGIGGIGGGGNGGRGSGATAPSTAGGANTGGGGGAGGVADGSNQGKAGGSGVVIIRYLGTPNGTGGTITQANGYTIHRFNSNGSFVYNGSTVAVADASSCGPAALTLTGTLSGNYTIDWYDAATGGNILATGQANFTTPVLNNTTTYYAAVRDVVTGCISSARLAVNATINNPPTVSANQSICAGLSPANITITGALGNIQWQVSTDSVNFTNIAGATSATLTSGQMGTLNAKRFYRAALSGGSCGNMNGPIVTVNVISAPAISNVTATSICGSGTSTLSGTSTGTINWYAATTGGVALATGSTYTTPTINTSTIYYYDVTGNGCTSTPRGSVTATVNALPNASSGSLSVELLVVGGGGGAGSLRGGGGGGGGYVSVPSFNVSGGSAIPITVGVGGAPGYDNAGTGVHALSGTNSSFGSTHIAIGGGGGGSYGGGPQNGYNGGSGGGGANQSSSANTGFGGTGTAGQGFNGGNSRCGGGGEVSGGGGGGAGGAGSNGTSSSCGACTARPYTPGNGGNGIQNSITGTAVWYAGGGGGGGLGANPIPGNCTSGAQNIHGTNGLGGGQASYGGGGQCKVVSGSFSAESGGPGIVVVKYAGAPVATGGTITQVGGFTIHTFTSNGTFTLPAAAVANNASRCGPGTVTFTGSSSGGFSLNWYDASTGGNLLASNTIGYTTPSINATTTYHTSIVNTVTGCESATRTAVTATVITGGTASANQTVCPGLLPNPIQLTGNSGTIQWQTSNDNITFTNIAGQTTATLPANSIGIMSGVKYIRAMVTGTCVTPSNVVTLSPANVNVLTPLTVNSYVWNGQSSTQWGTLANWYGYNGTTLVPAGSLPSSQHTTIVPSNGSCILSQPTFSTGSATIDDIILETGSQFTQSGGTILINGDFVNNGTLSATGGMVHFVGSNAATVSGTGSIQFAKMTVNKSAGGTLTLQSGVVVSDSLYMQQGNIFTSTNQLLTLGLNSTTPGRLVWNNGTVVGPFKRFFANAATAGTAGMFPVGTATYNRYAEFSFATSPGTNQFLTVQYVSGSPLTGGNVLYNGLPLWASNSLIQNYAADGYWNVVPTNNDYTSTINTVPYSISLFANNITGMQTPQICRIIKSAGSNTAGQHHVSWQGCGTHTPINGGASPLSFVISSTAVQGFSWFNIGTPNSQALPVEFAGMTTTCEEEAISIRWSTESEHNNDYFRIEKSADGGAWDILGYVDAVGNSSVLNGYEYLDVEYRSNSYYRLYQVDQDGSEELLSTLYTDCDVATDEITSFPNPSHESFSIFWKQFNTSGDGTITIRDINGKTMHHETVELSLGANLFIIKEHLAPGVYMIELMDDNYERKLIKHVVK
jgi:hypothetical protein